MHEHDINKIKEYYNQEAEGYIDQYKEGYAKYPANLIRINIVIDILKKCNAKSILSVGCGTCGPMVKLLEAGFIVKGFDFSDKMISVGKDILRTNNFDENLIKVADIENYVPDEKFDMVLSLGVFPHIINEQNALRNITKSLNDSGKVIIEFRNELFSTFTFNRYSSDFFMNKVIDKRHMNAELINELDAFFNHMNNYSVVPSNGNKLKYSDIYSKFHNPLSISKELFEPCGFTVDNILFYHYHALPPIFEKKYPELFRESSLKIEDPYDWRGYFMASAFMIEASIK